MTDPTSPIPGGTSSSSTPILEGPNGGPQDVKPAGLQGPSAASPRWSMTGGPPPGKENRVAGGNKPAAAAAAQARPVPLGERRLLDPETEEILQRAPPWLISLIIHMLALIVLGLCYITIEPRRTIEVETVFGEQIGEQLLDDSLELQGDVTDPTIDKSAFSPVDLPPVADPLAAPPPGLYTSPLGTLASSNINAPIGLALTGREKGFKSALLRHFGGNASTQDAVRRALEWLKRNQRSSGIWTLNGPFTDGSGDENEVAATALALIAFQGDGHTHQAGEYRTVVKKGSDALLKMQNKDGQFTSPYMVPTHQLYSHALATIAVCELYGMTEDSTIRSAAERAIQFCVDSQDDQGGWRYLPRNDSDTSVTGWFVMALQSARMARLAVPGETLANVARYLDQAQADGGSKYCYTAHTSRDPSTAMTAEGLLCRQYLGWKRDDPRLVGGANYLSGHPIRITNSDDDVYYWYYATQVMHHMEGKHWKRWNEVMRQIVPERQVKEGPENGSWNPGTYKWGRQGGRLFITCLHVYMLEVYYRHLPLYTNIYRQPSETQ